MGYLIVVSAEKERNLLLVLYFPARKKISF